MKPVLEDWPLKIGDSWVLGMYLSFNSPFQMTWQVTVCRTHRRVLIVTRSSRSEDSDDLWDCYEMLKCHEIDHRSISEWIWDCDCDWMIHYLSIFQNLSTLFHLYMMFCGFLILRFFFQISSNLSRSLHMCTWLGPGRNPRGHCCLPETAWYSRPSWHNNPWAPWSKSGDLR